MGKMIFSRKKSTFFFGDGMAGVSAGEVGKLRGGGRGEAPLHFFVDSFGADGKGGVFGVVAQVGKSA